MRVYRDGFLAFNKIKKDYLGFVYSNDVLFDVFQLKFWFDEQVNNCVMSGAERKRERSEERR